MWARDFDDDDDLGFIRAVMPIVDGVLRVVEPPEFHLVKIDNWFGAKWLGFSNKILGAAGVHRRATLRVPPFVPTRVVAQRFFRRAPNGEYVGEPTTVYLHVDQTSEANAKRLMSIVCPNAAVIWWSGSTRENQRGSLMVYYPTPEGHGGWYTELEYVDGWKVANTLCTTTRELSSLASSV